MLDTKLILFDGLPGAGKSTQGKWLEETLAAQGTKAHWYFEAEKDHPINPFDPRAENFDFGIVLENMHTYIPRFMKNWRDFAALVSQSNQVHILENMPYLNTLGFFLMANLDQQSIREYAAELRDILKPVNPAVIYFRQTDADKALKHTLEMRGKQFESEIFYNMTRFPFCQSRDLKDFDCVVTLWKTHIERMQEILPDFAPHYLELNVHKDDWQTVRDNLRKFLKLD